MMPPPAFQFHRLPGLKRCPFFSAAAVFVVAFASKKRLGLAWNWARLSYQMEAGLDEWLEAVLPDEEDAR